MQKMLLVGVWSFYSELSKNDYMLKNHGSGLGDDAFWGVNELYRKGNSNYIDFKTLDTVDDWSDLDAILVFDYPKPVNRKCSKSKIITEKILLHEIPSFLILHECEVIKKNNWDLVNHKNWKKIFTWNDDFIVDTSYIKLNMPPRKIPQNWGTTVIPSKFSTIIASNKKSNHPKEAYSDRLTCIEWFNDNHPQMLDLYGYGWDQYRLPDSNRLFEKLNRNSQLMKLFGTKYNVWKGELHCKQDIAGKYKFQFSYENAKNISGYILEKIFDTFLMGSVPIYLGANNIATHIPSDCFIDIRNYKNYDELYNSLSKMEDDEYLGYLSRIRKFIEGPDFYPFSSACYTETILDILTKELT